ncbi:MAG: DUF1538 domain-containing protein [Rhodospirillales bacterium]|nr:DUF1538 domain-containing protein [Rhodospirillales bacterium]
MEYGWIETIVSTFLGTMRDVAPIIILLFFFQYVVLRKPIRNLRRVIEGFFYVIAGLALFLIGLEEALFPLGDVMAQQLTSPAFIGGDPETLRWYDYYWIYIFAACIGLATTIAEPSLIAVAMKASEMSGGAISSWGLRMAVAIGVAASIALGAFRIVTGTPIHIYMIAGYIVVVVQTLLSPKWLVPLAYDSGGVTTSTVTVPLVTALGLGLATTVPGRSALIDGFGLIALASLFPMMTVMGYAQLSQWRSRRKEEQSKSEESFKNGENA